MTALKKGVRWEAARKTATDYLRHKLGDRRGCDVHEIVNGDDDIYREIVDELAVVLIDFASKEAGR